MHDELRIEMRARNNVLWHAIFDIWSSVAAFCRKSGVSPTTVGKLLNLKESPLGTKGTYRPGCVKLAEFLGFSPAELFPLDLYEIECPERVIEVPLQPLLASGEHPALAAPDDPHAEVVARELSDKTREALATLSARQKKILCMRFGIGEKSDHTLEEIAQEFEIEREPIRRIEAKALRRLRHPARAKRLKGFTEQ